jgi:hypothetical protein
MSPFIDANGKRMETSLSSSADAALAPPASLPPEGGASCEDGEEVSDVSPHAAAKASAARKKDSSATRLEIRSGFGLIMYSLS